MNLNEKKRKLSFFFILFLLYYFLQICKKYLQIYEILLKNNNRKFGLGLGSSWVKKDILI